MTPFERPPSLSALVTDHVRKMIVQGDLPLGAAISERGISAELNVSKTPVREALSQLRHEGLVTVIPQSGAKVFTLSAREVRELCTFRRILEPAAVALAMEQDARAFAEALDQVAQDMRRELGAGNTRAYLDLDSAFHQCFFDHCGNSYLQRSYGQFAGKIAALRTHLSGKPNHTSLSLDEHGEIVAAVRLGDMERLTALLDAHIGRTQETYEIHVEDISDS